MIRWLAPAALAAAALFAPPASAASFNCAFAGLPTEVAICQVPALGRADEAMAAQYFGLVTHAPPDVANAIRAEQRDWLASRNSCRYDAQCVLRAYDARLDRLGEWRDELEGAARNNGMQQPGDEEEQGSMDDSGDGDDQQQYDDNDGGNDGGYDSFGPESDPGTEDEVVPYEDPSGDAD